MKRFLISDRGGDKRIHSENYVCSNLRSGKEAGYKKLPSEHAKLNQSRGNKHSKPFFPPVVKLFFHQSPSLTPPHTPSLGLFLPIDHSLDNDHNFQNLGITQQSASQEKQPFNQHRFMEPTAVPDVSVNFMSAPILVRPSIPLISLLPSLPSPSNTKFQKLVRHAIPDRSKKEETEKKDKT